MGTNPVIPPVRLEAIGILEGISTTNLRMLREDDIDVRNLCHHQQVMAQLLHDVLLEMGQAAGDVR